MPLIASEYLGSAHMCTIAIAHSKLVIAQLKISLCILVQGKNESSRDWRAHGVSEVQLVSLLTGGHGFYRIRSTAAKPEEIYIGSTQ